MTANDVVGPEAKGGGVYLDGGTLYAVDADISANTATGDVVRGGGVYLNGGTLYLRHANVTSNHAAQPAGLGGGIYAAPGSVVTLSDSTYIGAHGPFGSMGNTAVAGGGIYADNARIYSLGGLDDHGEPRRVLCRRHRADKRQPLQRVCRDQRGLQLTRGRR